MTRAKSAARKKLLCGHGCMPEDNCCLCENKQLRAENAELTSALTLLVAEVDAWEAAVAAIIGRSPQTGMCTKPARGLLKHLAAKEKTNV